MQVTVTIWEQILPIDRGERYEAPIAQLLAETGRGQVLGAGTQLEETSGIEYVDIELEVNDTTVLQEVIDLLVERGVPKNSRLRIFRHDGQDDRIFGESEGVALTLPTIPSESDVHVLLKRIATASPDIDYRGAHSHRDSSLTMYFYGPDAETFWIALEPIITAAPICDDAEVVIRCGHPDGRPRSEKSKRSSPTESSDFYLRQGAWSAKEAASGDTADEDEGEEVFVSVSVIEDDTQIPWEELEIEVREHLLLDTTTLSNLNISLDVEASTYALYLWNLKTLFLSLPSTAEDTEDVIGEIAGVLAACEQHPLAIEKGIGQLTNPSWEPSQDVGRTEVEIEVRAADLADTLDPDVVHADARELMRDEWFWDDDDLAPFGTEDAARTVYDVAVLHRRGDVFDIAAHETALEKASGAARATDYWSAGSLPLAEPDGPNWDEVICTDEVTIAAAFAQLAIQGSIDLELRRRARMSLERQLRLDVPDGWVPRVSRMLEVLAQVDAPTT